MKDSEITIENFRERKFAIKSDCSLKELQFILKKVFPNDRVLPSGESKFYSSSNYNNTRWGLSDFTNLPIVSAKQFYQIITQTTMENKNRFPFNLTPENAQAIIDIACVEWKPKLAHNWGAYIALKENIKVSESYYKIMRNACTLLQHKLFDTIFGKDTIECPYKDGELIFVKDHENSTWELRYATGRLVNNKVEFYINQRNGFGNDTTTFNYHAPAHGAKLPE